MREYLAPRFEGLQHERFVGVFLDTDLQILGCENLAEGNATGAPVSVREVAKRVLMHDATAILLAHNHPSGNPAPSLADELITGRLRHALIELDIRLLDHLIFAGTHFYSFAESGIL